MCLLMLFIWKGEQSDFYSSADKKTLSNAVDQMLK